MLDLTGLRNKTQTIAELVAGVSVDQLRAFTNQSVDVLVNTIADSTDADVVFQPSDPEANDTFASDDSVVNIAWTLGHVVVHATASSEEGAALAAEMARGIELHGRSRYETPWETVTTIAQCRQRLEESRRIRLSSLDMWPDEPHFENTTTLGFMEGPINPVARFILGLMHEESHYAQLAEIVRQAKAGA